MTNIFNGCRWHDVEPCRFPYILLEMNIHFLNTVQECDFTANSSEKKEEKEKRVKFTNRLSLEHLLLFRAEICRNNESRPSGRNELC